jgi:hypothetical protein
MTEEEQTKKDGISFYTNNGVIPHAINKLIKGEEDMGLFIEEATAKRISEIVRKKEAKVGNVPLTDNERNVLCEAKITIIYPLPKFP